MFLHVSVCPGGGGVCPIACWDTFPWAHTHTPGRHPQADTPRQTPPGQTPPPLAQCMLGYGQQAGGTHPTGMQSCYELIYFLNVESVRSHFP